MKPFLLILLVACFVTACAGSSGQQPATTTCVVPASICQPTTGAGTGGGAPTCGLCPTEEFLAWEKQTGCNVADTLLCANGGTIYLDDHNYYCCTECPDECESKTNGGTGSHEGDD